MGGITLSYFTKSTQNISLEETKKEFGKIQRALERLLYIMGDDGENIEYEKEDLDQEFLRTQFCSLTDQLDDIYRRLNYLSKEVIEQGYIRHNESKRYELPSGTYFTSGSTCEILFNNEKYGEQYWVYTSIEHNGNDYYAKALGKDVSINGMMVRVRE